jgi:hypothetical protein
MDESSDYYTADSRARDFQRLSAIIKTAQLKFSIMKWRLRHRRFSLRLRLPSHRVFLSLVAPIEETRLLHRRALPAFSRPAKRRH